RERARLRVNAAANVYRAEQASFDNWIATRTATTDAQQDPEVIRRTHALDGLKETERSANADVDRLDAQILLVEQAQAQRQRRDGELNQAAGKQYDQAYRRQELRVFAIR